MNQTDTEILMLMIIIIIKNKVYFLNNKSAKIFQVSL